MAKRAHARILPTDQIRREIDDLSYQIVGFGRIFDAEDAEDAERR
jgi:hypothetical protein